MRTAVRILALWLAVAASVWAAEPGLLNLVMPDAAVVAGIRVDRILASPIGQSVLSQIDVPAEELTKVIALVGFDPRRDVSEVLIAAPAGTASKLQRGLLLARGSFDPARLSALASLGKAELTTYQGVQIASSKEKQPAALAFLDGSTLAVGDPESVRGAIGRRGSPVRLPAKFMAKVNELSGAYDIWGVSIMPPAEMAKALPNAQVSGALKGDMLQGIEQVSGGVRLSSRIDISFEALTRSEKDATALNDVVRFLTGLALSQGKPGAAKALENLQLKVEGRTVKFALTIPEQQVAQMIEAQKKAMAAQRARPKPAPERPADSSITIYSSPKDMGVVKLPGPK